MPTTRSRSSAGWVGSPTGRFSSSTPTPCRSSGIPSRLWPKPRRSNCGSSSRSESESTDSCPPSGEVSAGWRRRLDLLLGTQDWYDEFYDAQEPPTLFGEPEVRLVKASADILGNYFVRRQKTVFPTVAKEPDVRQNGKRVTPCYAALEARDGRPLMTRDGKNRTLDRRPTMTMRHQRFLPRSSRGLSYNGPCNRSSGVVIQLGYDRLSPTCEAVHTLVA